MEPSSIPPSLYSHQFLTSGDGRYLNSRFMIEALTVSLVVMPILALLKIVSATMLGFTAVIAGSALFLDGKRILPLITIPIGALLLGKMIGGAAGSCAILSPFIYSFALKASSYVSS